MRTVSNSRRMLNLAALAALTCLPLTSGGCFKSFLDQSVVARNQGPRLVVPILKSIDPIDEADMEFAGAEDVKEADRKAYAVDYVISRNDLLQVSVMDLMGGTGVENARTGRVSETGMLTLPLLNEPVPAVGLTEQGLQKAISAKYRDAGILSNAQVTVTVVEARGRTFSALGMVARPGQYAILDSDFRILNALVQCGDLTTTLTDYMYIVRKRQSEQPAKAAATTQPDEKTTVPGGQEPPKVTPGVDPLAPKTDPLLPAPDAPKKDEPKKDAPKKDEGKAPGAGANGAVAPMLAMMAEGKAAPTTARSDALAPTADGQERYIIIDGKPVLIGPNNQPINLPATNPSDVAVTAAATPVIPVTQPAYEFGEKSKAEEDVRVIRVPLQQLRNGDLRYNIVIRPSDTIIVPPPVTGIYYMGGQIGASGAYGINGNKITLKQAVAAARMLDPYAIPDKTDIIRRIGDNELFLRVDLAKVFDGREPDVYIKPNDVIIVGTDWYPPFLIALRTAFRISYGFGFLYDRNWAPQQKLNP
ncbi:MAG: polysaccharide biosynthesis/export family protein [Tepidisphaerales bacterium]